MGLRWSQRLILTATAAAVCLVPILGSLAHGHAHHEASRASSETVVAGHAPEHWSLTASHGTGDHQHFPSTVAALSRIGSDAIVLPVVTALEAELVTWAPLALAPGPDDPRPPRTHDPPASPRAPPVA